LEGNGKLHGERDEESQAIKVAIAVGSATSCSVTCRRSAPGLEIEERIASSSKALPRDVDRQEFPRGLESPLPPKRR